MNSEKMFEECSKLNDEIAELGKCDEVQKYIKLKSRYDEVYKKYKELSFKEELNNMKSCDHFFVSYRNDYTPGPYGGIRDKYYLCPKCNLDTLYIEVNDSPYGDIARGALYCYCHNDLFCSREQAKQIYSEITAEFPMISNEELLVLFEKKLDLQNIVQRIKK